jgi:hypothetical protein
MDAGNVKNAVRELSQFVPFKLPATGWHFAQEMPRGSITFDNESWTCMYKLFDSVAKGEKLCFSAQNTGCRYAAFYLGFEEPGDDEGAFLATSAGIKKTLELGIEHYATIEAPTPKEDYLMLERIEDIRDDVTIDVVNLWVDALSLTGLVTLANFDCKTNDSVIIPYASGCQGIWTLPYRETSEESPKAVVGTMDPVVRHYLPPDVLSFSMPTHHFIEMWKNIPQSFLKQDSWSTLLSEKAQSKKHDQIAVDLEQIHQIGG